MYMYSFPLYIFNWIYRYILGVTMSMVSRATGTPSPTESPSKSYPSRTIASHALPVAPPTASPLPQEHQPQQENSLLCRSQSL